MGVGTHEMSWTEQLNDFSFLHSICILVADTPYVQYVHVSVPVTFSAFLVILPSAVCCVSGVSTLCIP